MYCALSESEELAVSDDALVKRFRQSLEVGGLHGIANAGTATVLVCLLHTLPANTPISQMLERFVVATEAVPPRDVEVRCLRTASHFMDVVVTDAAHQASLARVIACMHTRDVFTTDLQYVLQQEEALRAAELAEEAAQLDAAAGRPSLRRIVSRVQHERAFNSTQTFANWCSQMQFGVTTSLHGQLLLYFCCAQTVEPDIALYRDMYTDTIIDRVSRRNNTVDVIDRYAVSRLIRSVRIYKHSVSNLIDFRVNCLAGLSVTARSKLSLAEVVQLYICCFQHRSVFDYCWKQVIPVMNHTIHDSCNKFRQSHVFDIDAVVRTLIDSSTVVGTTVAVEADAAAGSP